MLKYNQNSWVAKPRQQWTTTTKMHMINWTTIEVLTYQLPSGATMYLL